MTIHSGHPFAEASDPVRRLRGRLGGAVTLWTAGGGSAESGRSGLTVSSVMLAAGEPARFLALLDPDSALRETLEESGRGVVHLLRWEHRDLAEVFAGRMPAPGGPFTVGSWEQGSHGPLLASAPAWATVELESTDSVGWSDLVVARIVEIVVGDEDQDGDGDADGDGETLEHRRGRYRRAGRD